MPNRQAGKEEKNEPFSFLPSLASLVCIARGVAGL